MDPIQKTLRSLECLHKELYRIVETERIRFMPGLVKVSILHEKRSDT